MSKRKSSEKIIQKAHTLMEIIETKQKRIIDALLDYESYETAVDELKRSKDCLRNIHLETDDLLSAEISSLSAFLPLNLPIYSLICQAPIFLNTKIGAKRRPFLAQSPPLGHWEIVD